MDLQTIKNKIRILQNEQQHYIYTFASSKKSPNSTILAAQKLARYIVAIYDDIELYENEQLTKNAKIKDYAELLENLPEMENISVSAYDELKTFINNWRAKFLTTHPVFRVGDQTEGIEQKFKDLSDTSGEPSTENKAMQVVVNYCKRCGVQRESGGNRAFYSPAHDKIQVPGVKSYKTIEDYFSAMFHELAHSTGHPSRLNRAIDNIFGTADYAKEELIAEVCSALCLGQLHLNHEKTIKTTANYCIFWLRKIKGMTAKELTSAMHDAERAKNYIFGIKTDVED